MIERKTWKEFQECKLLWWINRILHTFGWAICLQIDEEGNITEAYPARVKYRGFSEESEVNGFIGITSYLKNNIEELEKEVNE